MEDTPRVGFWKNILKKKDENEFENEIVSMLNEGQEQGEILESEAEMITNIFDLDETSVSDIMTHRKNVSAIDCELSLEDAMNYIVEENFSRFPVYKGSIDNIIGILHIKDALRFYLNGQLRNVAIKDIDGILQTAHFIPETSKINSVFQSMQSEKSHMDIVVDEYGQTSGIVAMEDILEEIVGNIFDEHDEVEYNIVKTDDRTYTIKGLTPLEDITEETGIPFENEDFETINGYLISKIDRIPENDEGTVVEDENAMYRILKVEEKMISLIKMEIKENRKEFDEQ